LPPSPDTPDTLAAALADRYRLEREIGRGGLATVYLAHGRAWAGALDNGMARATTLVAALAELCFGGWLVARTRAKSGATA
jgi:hypothetical protein